jgi:hypothetical protein
MVRRRPGSLRDVESSFELVAVAFMRTTGGRVRVLLAIDRDGEQLFNGEPALLVEHRPGAALDTLEVDGPDGMSRSVTDAVAQVAGAALAELIAGSFTRDGSFDGGLLLGRSISIRLASGAFDM